MSQPLGTPLRNITQDVNGSFERTGEESFALSGYRVPDRFRDSASPLGMSWKESVSGFAKLLSIRIAFWEGLETG